MIKLSFCENDSPMAFWQKDKSKVKISQNFVTFSEYMNFKHVEDSDKTYCCEVEILLKVHSITVYWWDPSVCN